MNAVHGTALGLALSSHGSLVGLLLVGEPGTGKSRLAADLIAHCPYQRTGLIADDLIAFDENGWAIPCVKGPLLHLRGIGIAEVRPAPPLGVDYRVALGPSEEGLSHAALRSCQSIEIDPETATAASLRLALQSLASGRSLWCGFEPGPEPRKD